MTCEAHLLIAANFLLVAVTFGLGYVTYLLVRANKELNEITKDIGRKQAEHNEWERNRLEEANAPQIKFEGFFLMIPDYDASILVIGGHLKNVGATDAKLKRLTVEDIEKPLSGLIESGKSRQFNPKSETIDYSCPSNKKSLNVIVSYSDLDGNLFQRGIVCKRSKTLKSRFDADLGSYWFKPLS